MTAMSSSPSDQVLAWACQNGLNVPDHVRVQYVPGQGCGLFAARDLQDDQVVLEIPFHLALTMQRARQSTIAPVLSELGASPKTIFHFWLIYEKFTAGSYFGPYLQALPESFTDPPWWPDYSALKGTNMFAAVTDRLESINRDLERFSTALCSRGLMQPEWCTPTHLRWAYSVLSSRGFPARLAGLDDDASEGVGCLLPVADYFNHQLGGASTVQNWHVTAESVQFRGLRQSGFRVRAGQQIFTNYGAKSNEEFLMGYGFTLPGNPHDHVTLKLSQPQPDDPHAELQLRLLRDLPTSHFLQRRSPLPETLLQATSISLMTPIEAYTLPLRYQPETFLNTEIQQAVYETLLTLMRHARDRLPCNDEDRHNTEMSSIGHQEDVRNYVQGQHDILTDSIAALERLLGPVHSVTDSAEFLLQQLQFTASDGIVTKRALQAGDVIARISYTDLVTCNLSDGDSAPEYSLALYLLQSTQSATLLTPNSTLLWSENEIGLLGSEHVPAVALTHERLAEAASVYEQVRDGLQVEFPDFLRALSTVQSHLVTLTDGTSALPLTLPALPAHSCTPNAAFIEHSDELLLVARADIQAGELVTVTRGRALTNAELLVQYGQVVDANPFEVLELDLAASVAFADHDCVDISCQDLEIVHAFVGACPVPERLLRDLGPNRVRSLLEASHDVFDIHAQDLLSSENDSGVAAGSVPDLIRRYRGQMAELLQKVRRVCDAVPTVS